MKNSTLTRDRLINAACSEFAENGYANAKIRSITSEADANLASANYYFGGKAGLYLAAFAKTFEADSAALRTAGTGKAPDGELRAILEHYTELLLDKADNAELKTKLLLGEINNPGPCFEEVFDSTIFPPLELFSKLLASRAGNRPGMREFHAVVFHILAELLASGAGADRAALRESALSFIRQKKGK